MPFSSLGLIAPLTHAVAERNYTAPTPVQSAVIPAILRGDDVWASAQTGSGKTAAFTLPLLQHLASHPRERGAVSALVLVPTRELAAQVAEAFKTYGRLLPAPTIKVVTVFGGVSLNPQMISLRGGADVVVATPGRLLDLLKRNALTLEAITTLVLDEADRLLDLGFADELGRILRLLPRQRQSLLFSATFPPEVRELAEAILHAPFRFEGADTDTTAQPAAIVQRAIEVDPARRTQLLRHLVETNGWTRVLVFVATKYAAEHVAEKLRRADFDAWAFHGELSQGGRTAALARFKEAKVGILVVTDLAARGIDIVRLPVVVNYDLPRSATDYTHRIGRTGRAGESGIAVSFVCASTHDHFRLIEKRHGLAIPREQIPGFEPVEVDVPPAPVSPAGGGVKGKRKSKKDKLREAAARAAAIAARPNRPARRPRDW